MRLASLGGAVVHMAPASAVHVEVYPTAKPVCHKEKLSNGSLLIVLCTLCKCGSRVALKFGPPEEKDGAPFLTGIGLNFEFSACGIDAFLDKGQAHAVALRMRRTDAAEWFED